MATKKTGVTRLGPGRKVVAFTDAKAAEEEPMKKVTISLPASAHARFKIYAAQPGKAKPQNGHRLVAENRTARLGVSLFLPWSVSPGGTFTGYIAEAVLNETKSGAGVVMAPCYDCIML
jgi:hypothetical protein